MLQLNACTCIVGRDHGKVRKDLEDELKMDRDLATRKRKKSIEDGVKNVKKSMKNGSGN